MNVNIGFEIEVENNTKGRSHTPGYHETQNTNLHCLLDLSRDITKWTGYHIDHYHRGKSRARNGLWRIERDSSLYDGAEFIMPPLKKDEAVKTLIDFFEFIPESKCVTTDKCGLHMNISCGDDMTIDNIDLPYLLSNINYRLLYRLWKGRASKSSPYCKLPQDILKRLAGSPSWLTGNSSKDIKRASLTLLSSRDSIVNIRDFCETNDDNIRHYLEIRIMGGKNYHTKTDQIITTVNSFTKLLEKAQLKHDIKKHKRIVSYINRVSQKRETIVKLWLPLSGSFPPYNTNPYGNTRYHEVQLNHLLDQLRSVRDICKYNSAAVTEVLLKAYSNRTIISPVSLIRYDSSKKKPKYPDLSECLLKYCAAIMETTVRQYSTFFDSRSVPYNGLIDLINTLCYSMYYIIKYAYNNKENNNICNKLINLFLKKQICFNTNHS